MRSASLCRFHRLTLNNPRTWSGFTSDLDSTAFPQRRHDLFPHSLIPKERDIAVHALCVAESLAAACARHNRCATQKRFALWTARISTSRGRPPGFSGGSSGCRTAHASSERSTGYTSIPFPASPGTAVPSCSPSLLSTLSHGLPFFHLRSSIGLWSLFGHALRGHPFDSARIAPGSRGSFRRYVPGETPMMR